MSGVGANEQRHSTRHNVGSRRLCVSVVHAGRAFIDGRLSTPPSCPARTLYGISALARTPCAPSHTHHWFVVFFPEFAEPSDLNPQFGRAGRTLVCAEGRPV